MARFIPKKAILSNVDNFTVHEMGDKTIHDRKFHKSRRPILCLAER